jgi:hypothetical protein
MFMANEEEDYGERRKRNSSLTMRKISALVGFVSISAGLGFRPLSTHALLATALLINTTPHQQHNASSPLAQGGRIFSKDMECECAG